MAPLKTIRDALVQSGRAPRGKGRVEGDRARDNGNWAAAETHYAAHLEQKPDDSPIWIQLGHALKEQKKLADAEAAYRKALSLKPDSADGHIQLAHALKLQGKLSEAGAEYKRAYEIEPSSAIYQELLTINSKKTAKRSMPDMVRPPAHENMVYFEVLDLMNWMRAHKTLSGIQRVQSGIIENILAQEDEKHRYGFVITNEVENKVLQIWSEDMAAVIDYATGADVDHDELRRLVGLATSRAVEVIPAKGQSYFVLGAFWGTPDLGRYARLKRAGVAIGAYIYDIIPYSHPEFCDGELVKDFCRALADGLAWFDFVLTISEYTASEVRRLQHELGLRKIPVKAVPLAHLLKEELLTEPSDAWTDNIIELQHRRFALSVSTIEIRKNHGYLVSAWKLMLEQGLDVPDLVFVGRYGWRVNDLMEQLQATQFLNSRIHVLHDLSDPELETLYRACEFTLFPSFVEGWGLPVGESLAHGRPCLASNTSSIPEVGGTLVDYIDPHSVRSGVDAIRRMALDESYRQSRTAEIRSNFVARSWMQVTTELLSAIEELCKAPLVVETDLLLRTDELFLPREMTTSVPVPPAYFKRPLRLILTDNWFVPEAFGAWMRGRTGCLRFKSDLPPNTDVVVCLYLLGSPLSNSQRVEVVARDPDSDEPLTYDAPAKMEPVFPTSVTYGSNIRPLGQRRFMMRVNVRTSSKSIVEVGFLVHGPLTAKPQNDRRDISVGLIGMGHAARADHAMRLDIEEALSFA